MSTKDEMNLYSKYVIEMNMGGSSPLPFPQWQRVNKKQEVVKGTAQLLDAPKRLPAKLDPNNDNDEEITDAEIQEELNRSVDVRVPKGYVTQEEKIVESWKSNLPSTVGVLSPITSANGYGNSVSQEPAKGTIKRGTAAYDNYCNDVAAKVSSAIAMATNELIHEIKQKARDYRERHWSEMDNIFDALTDVCPDSAIRHCKGGWFVQVLTIDFADYGTWKTVSGILPSPSDAIKSALESPILADKIAERFPLFTKTELETIEDIENQERKRKQELKDAEVIAVEKKLAELQIELDEVTQSKNFTRAVKLQEEIEYIESILVIERQGAGKKQKPTEIEVEINSPESVSTEKSTRSVNSDSATYEMMLDSLIGLEVTAEKMFQGGKSDNTITGKYIGQTYQVGDRPEAFHAIQRLVKNKVVTTSIKPETIKYATEQTKKTSAELF